MSSFGQQPVPAVNLSNKEWKAKLSPQAYHVLRKKGTEKPYTGIYSNHKQEGTSSAKFDSNCGWPAFATPLEPKVVRAVEDNSLGLKRTEIQCANCHGHLGHVFGDGPGPEGTRYCINSASLQFQQK